MEPARRACWRCALLLALVAAGCADSLLRIDSHTDIAPHSEPQEQLRTTLRALYEQIIAPGERPKKLAEGFTFTEGPTWRRGKLYFSDMWFKNPPAGAWTGSPARSRLIMMQPDGSYRVLAHGMQSNGTIAARTIRVPQYGSASPSATMTCFTSSANHRSGRSRPRCTDSVIHPG